MRKLLLALALMPSLAACAGGPLSGPGTSLAGEPGLRPVVQQYYDARATEENGRCRAPLMEGVLTSRILESSPQQLVVRVRYLYRDLTADLRGACRNFGTRTFTVARDPDGFAVVDMTGGQHPSGLRLRLAD